MMIEGGLKMGCEMGKLFFSTSLINKFLDYRKRAAPNSFLDITPINNFTT